MKVPFAVLCLLVVGLSGCVIPYKFMSRQGAVGRVVDAKDGRPISGALITISTRDREMTATTGADGRFDLPSEKHWGPYIVPMDPAALPWSITVCAAGYRTYSKSESTTIMEPRSRELGDIQLGKEDRPNKAVDPTPGSAPRVSGGSSEG